MKKLFPLAAFLAVALAGLVMAAFAYVASEEAGRIKFQAVADDALARIEARIDLHLSLLRAAQAFLSVNQGAVSRQQYADFIGALDLDHTYTGLRGIGFMRLATPANAADVGAYLASQYPSRGASWQPSAADRQLPVVLFAPLQETTGIGYDMYSDPPRRPALEAALRDGAMHATGRVQLGKVGGAQPFAGFLVFLALRPEPQQDETTGSTGAPVEGVVYAAFRGNELFGAALGQSPLLPVNVEVFEGAEPADDKLLFRSQARPSADLSQSHLVTRQIDVAGQPWTLEFRPTEAFTLPSSRLTPVALGLVGLMLAAAIALLLRWQERAYRAVEALQRTTEKSLMERERMLQEMKHRIKNSIARVLAIARQTATHSDTIETFQGSFSARLQAMASSQDMLTRSRWQKADLRALLRTELEQVFGKDLDDDTLAGPPVELDETATQALGLTFHELATNALKYGEAGKGGSLNVAWELRQSGGQRTLGLTWREASSAPLSEPETTSFGTRLIDMNITRELGGTIRRKFHSDGLVVVIEVPLL